MQSSTVIICDGVRKVPTVGSWLGADLVSDVLLLYQ